MLITTCDNHYYDETDIEVGKPIDCKVVVNHHVELTEEEKAEARKEAIKRAENEVYSRMTQRKTAPKKENKHSNNGQMTLLF
jgi:folate-dependent phosphoribosylglycinamide formyltransferase PurN